MSLSIHLCDSLNLIPVSPEQHWSLMPLHAITSTVIPASCMYGNTSYGGPNSISFPQYALSFVTRPSPCNIITPWQVAGSEFEAKQAHATTWGYPNQDAIEGFWRQTRDQATLYPRPVPTYCSATNRTRRGELTSYFITSHLLTKSPPRA